MFVNKAFILKKVLKFESLKMMEGICRTENIGLTQRAAVNKGENASSVVYYKMKLILLVNVQEQWLFLRMLLTFFYISVYFKDNSLIIKNTEKDLAIFDKHVYKLHIKHFSWTNRVPIEYFCYSVFSHFLHTLF